MATPDRFADLVAVGVCPVGHVIVSARDVIRRPGRADRCRQCVNAVRREQQHAARARQPATRKRARIKPDQYLVRAGRAGEPDDIVDEVVVDRAVNGISVPMTPLEFQAAIDELASRGLTLAQIAERLHAGIQTIRDRVGRRSSENIQS